MVWLIQSPDDGHEPSVRFFTEDPKSPEHLSRGDNPWVVTAYVPASERDAALAEVGRLRSAIRDHRDQLGDNRCWVDDDVLYRAIGDETADTALPPKCDFLKSCERFWEQRQCPLDRGRATLPGGMTIAQLTAEVERLRADLKGGA